MAEQGGQIDISLTPVTFDAPVAVTLGELQPGQYLCLHVQDTGRGMDRAIAERVFDPFFTTKGPGQGVGLGLSVVHGIVKSHQGSIRLTSVPGQGATFEVFLPVSAPAPAGRGAVAAETPAPETPKGQGQRILLVDDEPALINVSTRLLRDLGYQVSAYGNPIDALERFRARPAEFDLVLTDLAMRLLSGTELAREVLSCRPDMPILMTTGLGSSVNAQNAREFGIREVIPKRAEGEQLGAAVFRALHGRGRVEGRNVAVDSGPVTAPAAGQGH
jgi:CheY-like chemotaxis protein